MMDRTEEFDAKVRAGYARTAALVQVVDPEDGRLIATLDVVDGTVTYSRSGGSIITQLSCVVADRLNELGTDETVKLARYGYGDDGDTYGGMGGYYGVFSMTIQSGALVPVGPELLVYAGLYVDDADVDPELILLGTFPLETATWNEDGTIAITARDRSMLVEQNAWALLPFSVAAGTNYADAIQALVENRLNAYWLSRIARDFTDSDWLTPKIDYGSSPGGNPWADACTMARVCGLELYFDRAGDVLLRAKADPVEDDPVWAIDAGPAGTLIGAPRKLSRPDTYSGVVVTGDGATTADPVQGESWDDFVGSPTNRAGRFGPKPLVVHTSLVTDSAMATNLANVLFSELAAVNDTAAVSFVPQYALEITDIVSVSHPERGIVDRTFAIDSLTVPLREGTPMSAALRRRKGDGEL